MRAHISNHDYELLSAYMDDQLAPGEKRKLEASMRMRPELQAALDELQQTRTLLRQAPRRHAPRNFILTPAMVRPTEPKRRGWNSLNLFPALSFTSALAALALVATLLFQLLPNRPVASPIAMQPSQPQVTEAARAAAPLEKMQSTEPEVTQTISATAASLAAGAAPAESQSSTPEPPAGAAPAAQPGIQALAPTETEAAPMMLAAPPTQTAQQPTPEPPSIAANIQPTRSSTEPPAPPNPENPSAPIIVWNGGPDNAPPGKGGGPNANLGPGLNAPGAGMATGMGGGQGSGDVFGLGGGAPDGNFIIPPEGVNSLPKMDTPTTEPSLPSAATPSGTGPILGVQENGGQITSTEAVMSNPLPTEKEATPMAVGQAAPTETSMPEPTPLPTVSEAVTDSASPSATTAAAVALEASSTPEIAQADQSASQSAQENTLSGTGARQSGTGARQALPTEPQNLVLLQILLGLIAVVAGAGAFIAHRSRN